MRRLSLPDLPILRKIRKSRECHRPGHHLSFSFVYVLHDFCRANTVPLKVNVKEDEVVKFLDFWSGKQ